MRVTEGMKGKDFVFETPWSSGNLFSERLKEQDKTILIFMRFYGCRICQLDITKIIASYDEFLRLGSQVFIVLQTSPEIIREQDDKDDIPLTIICDPKHELYQLYGVGTFEGRERPKEVTDKINEASRKSIKKIENNNDEIPNQLPATFIMNKENIVQYACYGKHTGDVPTVEALQNEIMKLRK